MKRCRFGATEKRGYTSNPLGRSDGERSSTPLWQMFRSTQRKTLRRLGKKSVDILDDSELSCCSGGDETRQVSEHPPLRFLE